MFRAIALFGFLAAVAQAEDRFMTLDEIRAEAKKAPRAPMMSGPVMYHPLDEVIPKRTQRKLDAKRKTAKREDGGK